MLSIITTMKCYPLWVGALPLSLPSRLGVLLLNIQSQTSIPTSLACPSQAGLHFCPVCWAGQKSHLTGLGGLQQSFLNS